MDEVGGKGVLLLHSVRFPAGQSRAQRSCGISGPKMTALAQRQCHPSLGVSWLPCCSLQLSAAQGGITGALELFGSSPAGKALSPEHRLGSAGLQCRPWFCTYWLLLEFFTLKRCMPQFSCGERERGRAVTLHGGLALPHSSGEGLEPFQGVPAPWQLPLPSDPLPSCPAEDAGRHI